MIDKGVQEHCIIACLAVSFGYALGFLSEQEHIGGLIAWALVSGIFIGREHNQNEVRWCNQFNNGHRAGAPWGCGFRLVTMDLHSWLGFLGPIVSGALVLGLFYSIERLITVLSQR